MELALRTVGLWAEYILWTTIDSNCCPVPVPWAYLWAVVHTYFGVWIKQQQFQVSVLGQDVEYTNRYILKFFEIFLHDNLYVFFDMAVRLFRV